ncbi:MBL fold metallo-hydrolase [Clostridium sp. DL1XJH146]
MSIRIVTLMEDRELKNSELKNEHGLSFYIEKDEEIILFDAGKSGDFIYNADKLGIDLKKVKHVILSHGHYDHTGGFRKFVKEFGKDFILHVKPDLFVPKYNIKEIPYRINGNNFDIEYINKEEINIDYVVEDTKEILDGVFLLASFEKKNEIEKVDFSFARRYGEDYVIDSFSDEVCVVMKSSKGLIVILGCSHPGVMNIMERIKKEFDEPIYYVIGGTHLKKAEKTRLDATFNYFVDSKIENIGLCHCTGEEVVDKFIEQGDNFFYNGVGKEIIIDK